MVVEVIETVEAGEELLTELALNRLAHDVPTRALLQAHGREAPPFEVGATRVHVAQQMLPNHQQRPELQVRQALAAQARGISSPHTLDAAARLFRRL